jgi:hypothetical protein
VLAMAGRVMSPSLPDHRQSAKHAVTTVDLASDSAGVDPSSVLDRAPIATLQRVCRRRAQSGGQPRGVTVAYGQTVGVCTGQTLSRSARMPDIASGSVGVIRVQATPPRSTCVTN